MKVVINSSYGGFYLSLEAHILYAKLKGYNLITRGDDTYQIFYKNEENDENGKCILNELKTKVTVFLDKTDEENPNILRRIFGF